MAELTTLEKKEAITLGKRLKSKTHFALGEILKWMELYRKNALKMDGMDKDEFICVINRNLNTRTRMA